MRGITIAIDGPAASGKSTTAAAVAEALGYCHLNSGQLYRAITWASLRGAWNGSENRFRRELERLDLRLDRHTPGYRVLVNGRDIGEGLVSVETSSHVSAVSTRKSVRDKVLAMLRNEGGQGGVVCDGRDIGTVVFPDAELKVFLIASAEERGRRRLRDRGLELTPDGIRSCKRGTRRILNGYWPRCVGHPMPSYSIQRLSRPPRSWIAS
jgi:cytidylate kinase